ncbi:uncharacterized protein LOC131670758 [Phymastichus coffea]|uniref:uncharacterized protein LOC131670758 n=1 Tax=Phymastichus coffea TaxID=108790 RepID=UPI00273A939F|nr:uncharacterized protein LOC131670758 [Phymastichus coffea]
MTIHELEPSPCMSARGAGGAADDELSNSDGPLIATKSKDGNSRSKMNSPAMLLQDNWHKGYASKEDRCANDEKKSHRCVWTLSIALGFVGLCNLLLNLTILVVLRVGQGMESIEMIPDDNLVKFYGNTDLDRVCLHSGVCEGFGDKPVELIGDDAGISIQVTSPQHSMTWSNLQILKNGTSVSQVHSFQVKDPRSGSPVFSTDFPNFSLPQGVEKIEVDITQTHRIAAPKRSDLTVTSGEAISLHGAEGTSMDSKDIMLAASNDILLRSKNGDIIIDAKQSINLPKIPIASVNFPSNELQDQYKVCVCMPDGKIFLVPVNRPHAKINCAKAVRSMDTDPCAV